MDGFRLSLTHRYVKVYLLPDNTSRSKKKTAMKRKTLNPVYNETMKVSSLSLIIILQISPMNLKYITELAALFLSPLNYKMLPVPVQSAQTGPPGSCAESVSLALGENEEKPVPGGGGGEAGSVGLEPEPTNLAQPPAKSEPDSEIVCIPNHIRS